MSRESPGEAHGTYRRLSGRVRLRRRQAHAQPSVSRDLDDIARAAGTHWPVYILDVIARHCAATELEDNSIKAFVTPRANLSQDRGSQVGLSLFDDGIRPSGSLGRFIKPSGTVCLKGARPCAVIKTAEVIAHDRGETPADVYSCGLPRAGLKVCLPYRERFLCLEMRQVVKELFGDENSTADECRNGL